MTAGTPTPPWWMVIRANFSGGWDVQGKGFGFWRVVRLYPVCDVVGDDWTRQIHVVYRHLCTGTSSQVIWPMSPVQSEMPIGWRVLVAMFRGVTAMRNGWSRIHRIFIVGGCRSMQEPWLNRKTGRWKWWVNWGSRDVWRWRKWIIWCSFSTLQIILLLTHKVL